MGCKNCKCTGIEFRNSKTHGIGIFAIKDIWKGDKVEECPIPAQFIPFDWEMNIETGLLEPRSNAVMNNYRFSGPKHPKNGQQFWVIPGGMCMFYNSKPKDTCNVGAKLYIQRRVMEITALKDIQKDEELFLNYTTPNMKETGHIHTPQKKSNEGKCNHKS